MINVLGIFLGGGIGAILRHFLCRMIGCHWAVMAVNLLGALIIGAAVQFFAAQTDLRPEVKSFVITGILGGFTTFSTYMLDFGTLAGGQRWGEAWFYLLGSLILGIACLFVGMRLGRIFWTA